MSSIPSQVGVNRPAARVDVPSGALNISAGPGAVEGAAGALFQASNAFRAAEEEINRSRQSRMLAESKGRIMRQLSELATEAVKQNDPDVIRRMTQEGLTRIRQENVDPVADEQVKDRLVGFFESTSATTSGRMLGVIADRSKRIERQSLETQARETATAAARLNRLGNIEEAQTLIADMELAIDESTISAFDTDEEAAEFKRAARMLVQTTDFQSMLDENPVVALEMVRSDVFPDIEGQARANLEKRALAAVDQAFRDDVATLRRDDPNKALNFIDESAVSDLVPQTSDVLKRSLEEQLRVEGRVRLSEQQQAEKDVRDLWTTRIETAFAPGAAPLSDEDAANFIRRMDSQTENIDQGLRNDLGFQFLNSMSRQRANGFRKRVANYEQDPLRNELPTVAEINGDNFLGRPEFSTMAGVLINKVQSMQAVLNAKRNKQIEVRDFISQNKAIPTSHRDAFNKEYNATFLPQIQEAILRNAAPQNDQAAAVVAGLNTLRSPDASEAEKDAARAAIQQNMQAVQVDDLTIARATVEAMPSARMMPTMVKQSISKGLRSDDPDQFLNAMAIYRDGVNLRIPDEELALDTDDRDLANTFMRIHLPGQDPIKLRDKIIEDMKPTTNRLTESQARAVERRAIEELTAELIAEDEDDEVFEDLEDDAKNPQNHQEVLNKVPQDVFTRYIDQSLLEARNSTNPEVAITRVKRRMLRNIGVSSMDGKPRVMWMAPEKVYSDLNFEVDGHNALRLDLTDTINDAVESGALDMPAEFMADWRRAVRSSFDPGFQFLGSTPAAPTDEQVQVQMDDPRFRAKVLMSKRVQDLITKSVRIEADPRFIQDDGVGGKRPQYMIRIIDEDNPEGVAAVRFQVDGDAREATGYARWRPDTNTGLIKGIRDDLQRQNLKRVRALRQSREMQAAPVAGMAPFGF